MVSFYIYDVAFLVVFTLAIVIFLYKRRKNLQRQGLLYLYRTRVGIKFIEWTSKRFPKTLKALQYLVVACGYVLMIGMVYLLIRFSYFYLTSPIAAKAIKVPVIIPLVPYLPEIFNLDFLPPFYFTYWIIIIAIIAIPHEFAHGIFARLHKIKIHSTGFGFLGPFLAAFVEPDEKQMEKKKKFPQLAVLAAGTFANIIFTVIFSLLFWLFFVSAFSPAGVVFDSYASTIVSISDINAIEGKNVSDLNQIKDFVDKEKQFVEIEVNGDKFYASSKSLIFSLENDFDKIQAILDSPAFRARLPRIISAIDKNEVRNFDELTEILRKHKSGDKIIIKAVEDDESVKDYEITLASFEGRAFLGIGVTPIDRKGILGWLYSVLSEIKNPFVHYKSDWGNFGIFIYNLLQWCVLISVSVALVNMLPLGIFDGGRFFYLTIWGLTGSKKIGAKAFKASTYLILLLIMALMIKWLFVFV